MAYVTLNEDALITAPFKASLFRNICVEVICLRKLYNKRTITSAIFSMIFL